MSREIDRESPFSFRDRDSGAPGMLLPPSACGKYDVSRQLEAAPSAKKAEPIALLNAA